MGVAKSGYRWQLAPSLISLETEADRIAPRRSRVSDGSIGDPNHSNRISDHNPSGGFVHAIDITHDPRGGMDIHAQARKIAARHDGRIKYIISNNMIAEAENGFRWRRYNGANPHTHHAHFSVRPTRLARYDTSPWFGGIILFPTAPIPKPPTIVVDEISPGTSPIPPLNQILAEEEMKIYLLQWPSRKQPGEYWVCWPNRTRHGIPDINFLNTLNLLNGETPVVINDDWTSDVIKRTWIEVAY